MIHFVWNINNSFADTIANNGPIHSMCPRLRNALAFRRRPYWSRLAAGANGGWADLGLGSHVVRLDSTFPHILFATKCMLALQRLLYVALIFVVPNN